MSTNYKINVNNFFQFDFEKEQVAQLDSVSIEANKFHVLHQNTPYKAEISEANFNQKKYTVKINNNSYTVAIADALDSLIKEMGFEIGVIKQVNAIKAPMPGLILEINVTVGQEVKESESLLILEAMKMENSFLSPRDGTIKSISVSKGESVDKGQLLIEFE